MSVVIHCNKKALIHWVEANFDWESPDAKKAWDDFYFVDYDALIDNAIIFESEFDRILGRKFSETFMITDSVKKTAICKYIENFMVETRFQRISKFIREFEEVAYLSTEIKKQISKNIQQGFSLVDEYIRKANGVYSDLYISKVPVNAADFESELYRGTPYGYEKFTTYIPGYYEFESAMFRMVLRSVGLDRIRLKKLKMIVDVPDVFDRGVALVDSGNDGVVKFNRKYIKPPKVIGMQSGGAETAVRVEIDNITNEKFTFRMFDAEGNKIGGSLSWISEGY